MYAQTSKYRGINQEVGIDTYTLLYINQIINKDLLYSPGNYSQYFVIIHKKKESEEEYTYIYMFIQGIPWWLIDKEPVCNAGDLGSIPGLGRSLGEGNGYLLQYSCLENPVDRRTWQARSIGSQRVGHDITESLCCTPKTNTT